MAELAEQRLKAFEEELGLIRTRGKGQGMHIAKTKAEKAPGQLLSHACLCPALPEGGSHPHAVGQKNAQSAASTIHQKPYKQLPFSASRRRLQCWPHAPAYVP